MPQSVLFRDFVWLWAALVVTGLLCRPLLPVDETRAVSVAWEMWQSGDFLVPHLNGETYSHKPPLLQWGIHLAWRLAGVNDWSARLVAPLFGLGSLFLTASLARLLWPERAEVRHLAPLILLSFPVWALWTSLTLYDLLVVFFTLVGMQGLWRSGRGEAGLGRWLTGLAIGGGVLSKGPVILLLILPAGLLAPRWLERPPARGWRNWYGNLLGSVLLGALLALAWAIPAGWAGGEDYRRAIFWGQSAGRIAHSFAHDRPWWWYGAVLPILLFPWAFRLSLWRGGKLPEFAADSGFRFCLLHLAGVTLALSLVGGKQIHYLLPALPAAALILARVLPGSPERLARLDGRILGAGLVLLGLALWILPRLPAGGGDPGRIVAAAPPVAGLAFLGAGLLLWWRHSGEARSASRRTAYALIACIMAAHLVYRAGKSPQDDMRPMALRLAEKQGRGAAIAYWGKYSGDFQFLGRLRQPLDVLMNGAELADWLAAHPDGYLLIVQRGPAQTAGAEFVQDYRSFRRRISLWKASVLNADPTLAASVTGRRGDAEEADR